MKLLWLTLADPDPPDNGQFLYSSELIRGMASCGAELEVVGLRRPGARHRDGEQSGGLYWSLAEHRPRSKWASLLSGLPRDVCRTRTAEMEHRIGEACRRDDWDAIVFDSITIGWALGAVLRRYRRAARRPRIVHISHNFEQGVARRIAADEGRPPVRLAKRFDAFKVARVERALTRRADLVTSNSPDDLARFLALSPRVPMVFLPPGYHGHDVAGRMISAATPRRAVIVGSYDWIAKRNSLEAFLAVADPHFRPAGIELLLVGRAEEAFLAKLRERYPWLVCTGPVADVAPYMAAARLALVPDLIGGFKLKSLDYVFNRIPILGIEGTVPGIPVTSGEGILLFSDHAGLAKGVLDAIDDFDRLNRLQNRAYEACRGRFDTARLCQELLAAIAALDRDGPLHAMADATPKRRAGLEFVPPEWNKL